MQLNLPHRTQKPRENGITMVIDTGIPLQTVEHHLENSRDYIDYVKLGWGTALVTKNLDAKLNLYKKFQIPISLGGTFFELALLQNKLEQFEAYLEEKGIGYIEISDGTIELPLNDKLHLIERLSKKFKVLSEVGSKDSKAVVAPKRWVKEIRSSLDAGAWKIIAEGRESGQAGLYRESSEIRTGLVEELLDEIKKDDLIFEAPQKAQQAWFIKELGSNVNLGNIAFTDVLALETLRLGLRSDTLLHFHGEQ